MRHDHSFDPETPAREERHDPERVRREVVRLARRQEESDDDLPDEHNLPDEQEQAAEDTPKKSGGLWPFIWQFISGTVLVNKDVSGYYPYMLGIAGMFLLSIAVFFTALHLDRKYMRLERQVQILRERSIRLQELRYRATTHTAIVEQLRERGIDLKDPQAPGLIIEN